jgi:NAD(P)-dependent dehydrogenase (short-subunit alcohol dehydrogenase family)
MLKRFSAEGATLVAGDWNAQRLEQTVASVQAQGARIVSLQGNIAEKEVAERLVETAVHTYGRIDILCNNAGVMDNNQGIGEVGDEMWRRTLGINLDGPAFTSRCAIPYMVNQGSGAIINIASMAAVSGAAGGVAYTVSKHGVVGLTRSTAWIYGPKGIRCNAICPGGVQTNIAESMDFSRVDPAATGRIMGFTSLIPTMLAPDEIAALALFLVSDEACHINGAIIPADAGWRAA